MFKKTVAQIKKFVYSVYISFLFLNIKMEAICREFSKYIVGGFGVIPALAWNDFIKDVFSKIVPKNWNNTLTGKLTYALLITLICLLVIKVIEKCLNVIKTSVEKICS
jgi:Mg2+/Co2+ transporter CorB